MERVDKLLTRLGPEITAYMQASSATVKAVISCPWGDPAIAAAARAEARASQAVNWTLAELRLAWMNCFTPAPAAQEETSEH